MKNFYKIIFFSSFIFIMFNLHEAQAETFPLCDPDYTNESGEINLDLVPGTKTCLAGATSIEQTIYEFYLCTSAPTAPTTGSAIEKSSCTLVFRNSAGFTMSLTAEGSESLVGETFKPPAGNYTHAYVRLDNIFGVTGSVTFSNQDYDGQGNEGSGTTCATRSTTQENLTGTTFPQNTSLCGDSDITAEKKLIKLQSLDCCDGLLVTDTDSDTNINGSGQSGHPSLVDANGLLITSEAQAESLDYIATFGSEVVIGENLTNLNLSFNVSSSLEVTNYETDFILFMLGAPQIIIETTHSSS